ncbi:SPASM domain-containing protein, partial [Sulfuracidifex metallicus]|uniref:SPASM domain-containing protein n=1 Tax=Sulfuracidifex metallicus TaxID=47303 RepID=UPI000AC90B09
IVNLVKASLDEGLRVAIGINSIKGSFYILEKVKEVLSKKLNLSVDTLEKKVFFIEDQPTPVGEATLLYSENKEKFELNSEKLNVGCTNIGRTLALMPNGDVKICCGHPIFQYVDDPNDLYLIGNIMREDLVSMVKKAQSVLLYWWIHFLGPKKFWKK